MKAIRTEQLNGKIFPDWFLARFRGELPVAPTPDPSITPPWLDLPSAIVIPQLPAATEPCILSNNVGNIRDDIRPADEDDDREPPTIHGAAPGWYRKGETFYRIGSGPHALFCNYGHAPPKFEREDEGPAATCGPAKQAMLF